VQSVLRNAAAYRRIYGAKLALAEIEAATPVAKVTPAKSTVKKAKHPPSRT
jgi:hypothetical protein